MGEQSTLDADIADASAACQDYRREVAALQQDAGALRRKLRRAHTVLRGHRAVQRRFAVESELAVHEKQRAVPSTETLMQVKHQLQGLAFKFLTSSTVGAAGGDYSLSRHSLGAGVARRIGTPTIRPREGLTGGWTPGMGGGGLLGGGVAGGSTGGLLGGGGVERWRNAGETGMLTPTTSRGLSFGAAYN